MWGLFMSIFNRSLKKDNQLISKSDFERQILRLNTLEVQMKNLLAFESSIRVALMKEGKNDIEGIKKSTDSIENRIPTINNMQQNTQIKKLNEIKLKINRLEDTVRAIESQIASNSLTYKGEIIHEQQLFNMIDKYLKEKLLDQQTKEKLMEDRIKKLEVMVLDGFIKKSKKDNYSLVDKSANNRRIDSSLSDRKEERIEENHEIPFSKMKELINLLSNYQTLKSVQADQDNKIRDVEQKIDMLMERYKEVSDEETAKKHGELKNFYIDKLYIEKYELANNIDQIGVRELSGALNIGATYGKDVVPKEVSDDIKKQFKSIKPDNAEKEVEKDKDKDEEKDEEKHYQGKENSTKDFTKEEESFTIVDIED